MALRNVKDNLNKKKRELEEQQKRAAVRANANKKATPAKPAKTVYYSNKNKSAVQNVGKAVTKKTATAVQKNPKATPYQRQKNAQANVKNKQIKYSPMTKDYSKGTQKSLGGRSLFTEVGSAAFAAQEPNNRYFSLRNRRVSMSPLEQLQADILAGRGAWLSDLGAKQKELSDKEKAKKIVAGAKTRLRNRQIERQEVSEYDRKYMNSAQIRQKQEASLRYKEAQRAGDKAGMEKAHRDAENLRKIHGYSGGTAGNEYLSPKVPQDVYNRLNNQGITAWKQAKMGRQKAVTEDEIARADKRLEEILNAPGYRKGPATDADTSRGWGYDSEGRRMWSGTKEQNMEDARQAKAAWQATGEGIVGGLAYSGQIANRVSRDKYEAANMNKWIVDADNYISAQSDLEYYDNFVKMFGHPPDGYPNRNVLVMRLNDAIQAKAQLERVRGDVDSLYFDPALAEYYGLPTTRDETFGERMLRQAAEHQAEATEGMSGAEKFVTNALISTGQSLPGMALGVIPGVGPALGLGVLGLQAGGSRAYDLTQQGLTAEEALRGGLVSGGIEILTEKLPLESFADIVKGAGGRSAIRNVLKQAGLEGSEEAVSYIGNWIADEAMNHPDAQFSWTELLENAGMGAVSGGMLGVGGSVIGERRASMPQVEEIQERTQEHANVVSQAQDAVIDTQTEEARRLKTDATVYNELVKSGALSQGEKAQMKADLEARYAELAGQPVQQTSSQPEAPRTLEEAAQQRVQAELPFVPWERSKFPPSSLIGNLIDAARENNARNKAVDQLRADQEMFRAQQAERRAEAQAVPAQAEAQSAVRMEAPRTVESQTPQVGVSTERSMIQPDQARSILARYSQKFGENGQKAIMAAYRDTEDLGAYRKAFAQVYDQAFNGKTQEQIRQPQALSGPQFYAAVQSGIKDRGISMSRGGAVTANRNAGLVLDNYSRKLDRETFRVLDGLAKAGGTSIEFVDASMLDNPAAQGQIDGNRILIRKNAPDPVAFVAGHETTHRLKTVSPQEYTAFRDYVITQAAIPGAVDTKIAEYARRGGVKLSREAAMDEIAADYAGNLVNSSQELQKFIRDNYTNKTLLERVLDVFREIANALTGGERVRVDKSVRLLEEALGAASERVGQMETEQNTTQKSGGTRYSTKSEVLALDGVDWMDNYSSIKQQLEKHAEEISDMEPVVIVDYTPKSAARLVSMMMHEVSRIGGQRMKRNGITFDFDETGAKTIDTHARRHELRAAALAAPYVAKYGKLIAGQKNHENTGMTTLTFAAPAVINGETVNVGVVIQFQANGRPRAVNVALQSGGVFKLDIKKAPEGPDSRISRYGQGTALSTTDADTSIRQTGKESKRFSLPFEEEEAKPRFSFGGVRARTADHAMLEQAEKMEQSGAEKETIRQETGWFRGMDGKWRFEIDNSPAVYRWGGDAVFRREHPAYGAYQDMMDRLLQGDGLSAEESKRLRALDDTWGREYGRLSERTRRGNATLGDILEHDTLFAAYPELRDIRILFEDMLGGGRYEPGRNAIILDRYDKAGRESTLIHEIQHAIQEIEEFTPGASGAYWQSRREDYPGRTAKDLYRDTAGEIEARDAARRRNMTAEERRNVPPDIGNEDTVFAERRQSGEGRRYSIGVANSDAVYDFDVTQKDINDYVDSAYATENTQDYKKYLKVSDRLADDIQGKIPDIREYTHALRDNDIRHIRNSHGEETNEKYPVTAFDQKSIPDIVENYDKVIVKTRNGEPGIVYVKVTPENLVYYLEAVTTKYHNEKLLVNKQMIKTGINDIPNMPGLEEAIKKEQPLNDFLADLQEIHKAYARSASQEGTASMNSIRQEDEKSNPRKSLGTGGFDQAKLMRENEKLRGRVEYWKGQTKKSDRTKVDPKEVRKLAKKLAGDFSTTMDTAEISGQLQAIYDGLGKDWTYDQAYEAAHSLAREMVEQASEADGFLYNEYEPLRKFFRETPLVLSASDRRQITDYNDWRKSQMGKLRIQHGEQSNIDQVYQEVSQLWPEWFDEERDVTSLDQLERIAEVMDGIYTQEETNPFQDDLEGPAGYLAAEIMDNFWDLPNVKKTWADRAEARLGREVTRRLDMQEKYQEKLQQVREDRDAKLRRKSEEYLGRTRARSQRQKERELRAKIVRHCGRLSAKLKSGTDKQHVPEVMQRIVATALDSINLGSGFTLVYDENGKAKRVKDGSGETTKRTEAFEDLRKFYQQIITADPDEDLAGEMPEIISKIVVSDELPKMIDGIIGLRDTPIANLGKEDLDKIWETVNAIETTISTYDKALGQARFETISEPAFAIQDYAAPKKDRRNYAGAMKHVDRLLNVGMLKPIYFLYRLGDGGKMIWKMIEDAQGTNIRYLDEIRAYQEEHFKPGTAKRLEKKKHTFNFDGQKIELTTAQLINLYNLRKREQAEGHILEGGFRPDQIVKGIRDVTPAAPWHFTAEQIGEMLNVVARDAELVRIADSMMDGIKPQAVHGNAASMEVYGIKKYRERNYWPIESDENQIQTDIKNEAVSKTVAGSGFAKATQKGANNAIILRSAFDVYDDHVVGMAKYAAWLGPLENLRRILNFRYKDETGHFGSGVKEMLTKIIGKDGPGYYKKLMDDLNAGIKATSDNPFQQFIGSYKAAAIAGNIRVVVQQPTSIMRALEEIDPQDFLLGMAEARPGQWENEIKKYAPIAIWKDWGYFTADTGRQMRNIFWGDDNILQTANNFIMNNRVFSPGAADAVTWMAIWNAVKRETKRTRKDLNPDAEEFMYAVRDRFNEVINLTQVVDGIPQRSQLMRSENDVTKMATSFMAEPTTTYNMASYALHNARTSTGAERGKAMRDLARTTMALVSSIALVAAAQSLVDAMRDDDKDETYWEKFFQALYGWEGETRKDRIKSAVLNGNLGAGMNPLTYIPFVKDIVSKRQGYKVTRMDMDIISRVMDSYDALVKAMSGEGKKTRKNAWINFIAECSRFLGVPVANIKRDILSGVSTVFQATGNYRYQYELEKFLYNIEGTGNFSEFAKLAYLAKRDGDTEAYEAIRADLIANGPKSEKDVDKKIAEFEKKAVTDTAEYQTKLANLSDSYATMLESNATFQAMDAEQQDKARTTMANYAEYQVLGDRIEVDNSQMENLSSIESQGINPADWVVFKAQFDTLHSDKDANGKDIPGQKKQDKAIKLINETFETDEEKCAVYRTVYDSDANNPWA